MASTDTSKPEGLRPARRTIVKGAAWAVPAVAVASAAPAYAASPTFQLTGVTVGCKISNQNVYHLEVEIENTGNQPNTITGVQVTGMSSNDTTISWPIVPDQCMCPGDKWLLVINSGTEDSIASFGSTIQWAGASPQTLTLASDTTPDCNSVGAPYASINTPSTAQWIRQSGADCAGCA